MIIKVRAFLLCIIAFMSAFLGLGASPLVLAQTAGKIAITESDYSNQSVEMADVFRQDGKIYVVVAVIMTLLIGLFIYLFWLEKRISKLEKEIPSSV